MKYFSTIISVFLCLLVWCASVAASPTIEKELKALVVANPDSLLYLLDNTEYADSLPEFRADLLRALAYNEKRMFHNKERYALRALESDSISGVPSLEVQALLMVSSTRAFFEDYTQAISYAERAMNLAREVGNVPGQCNILVTMSGIAFDMGDRARGYSYLEAAIEAGKESDDARVLANVSSALGAKIIALYTDDRFEEAIDQSRRRLDVIERIEKLGTAPAGFTDQQRAYTYARIASSAQMAGRKDEAREAYRQFLSTDYGQSIEGRAFITDYLLTSGQWQTVLDFTTPLFPLFQSGDTINSDFESLLVSQARAEAGLGNWRRGYSMLERAMAVNDSIHLRESAGKAQELAAEFDLNEKEHQLREAQLENARRSTLVKGICIAGLLVLIILVIIRRNYRESLRRDRIAARQLTELTERREQAYSEAVASVAADKENSGDNGDEYAEYLRMESKLVESKLFLTNTNREDISESTGLTRAKAVLLIQKYADCTPAEYLNKLRVDYSVKLMREYPEWTIEAIAAEAGFSSRNTYYKNFSKFYGITPAQYRKQLNQQ